MKKIILALLIIGSTSLVSATELPEMRCVAKDSSNIVVEMYGETVSTGKNSKNVPMEIAGTLVLNPGEQVYDYKLSFTLESVLEGKMVPAVVGVSREDGSNEILLAVSENSKNAILAKSNKTYVLECSNPGFRKK